MTIASSTTVSPHAPDAATSSPRASGLRLMAHPTVDLDAYARAHGPLPWSGTAGRLIPVVEAAGLLGRGGAGFPTARKLAAVAAGRGAVVIGNGAEGEPASSKDRTLLSLAPHLVLDGLQLAAEAVDAEKVYLHVPEPLCEHLRTQLSRRRRAGWDRYRVEVVASVDAFVSGEESAVVSRVEGRAPLPRTKQALVVTSGVRGAPTLVQNVETLAHIALVARRGAAWFREVGTAEEPGTFLATLSGAVAAPGVYEAPYGIGLGELLAAAGGASAPPRAVLVGGYHGTWLPADPELRLSRKDLRPLGGSPGAGVVVALATSHCGLAESARIAEYLAHQTANQCGPCLNGLPRMADTLTRLARHGRDPRLPGEIERLAGLVEGRGACRHPDGTARFVRSTLWAFADEVRLHLSGRCSVASTTRPHGTDVPASR
jgi:NADH:ubiquinone oxidoreductase subunit F (NADH-binding)